MHEDGNCEINIPTLKEIDSKNGKLVIEAIADSTYFKVYEATVEITTPVKVELVETQSSLATAKPKITMSRAKPTVVKESVEPIKEKPKPKKTSKQESFESFENYIKSKISSKK